MLLLSSGVLERSREFPSVYIEELAGVPSAGYAGSMVQQVEDGGESGLLGGLERPDERKWIFCGGEDFE